MSGGVRALFCPRCGAKAPVGGQTQFCDRCGARLSIHRRQGSNWAVTATLLLMTVAIVGAAAATVNGRVSLSQWWSLLWNHEVTVGGNFILYIPKQPFSLHRYQWQLGEIVDDWNRLSQEMGHALGVPGLFYDPSRSKVNQYVQAQDPVLAYVFRELERRRCVEVLEEVESKGTVTVGQYTARAATGCD